MDELAGHADQMEELSGKCKELGRAKADAWIWRAVTARDKGDERCFALFPPGHADAGHH